MARYGKQGRFENTWIPDHISIKQIGERWWLVANAQPIEWYGDEYTAVMAAQAIPCLPNCSCVCRHGSNLHQWCPECDLDTFNGG